MDRTQRISGSVQVVGPQPQPARSILNANAESVAILTAIDERLSEMAQASSRQNAIALAQLKVQLAALSNFNGAGFVPLEVPAF